MNDLAVEGFYLLASQTRVWFLGNARCDGYTQFRRIQPRVLSKLVITRVFPAANVNEDQYRAGRARSHET